MRTRIILAAAAGLAVAIAAADRTRQVLQLSGSYIPKAAGLFALVLAIVIARFETHHPFPRLGPATVTTMARALMVALVAAFIGEPARADVAWTAAILALVITVLDGVDGWLARRTRLASDFGARFDMEVDALLIMVLAILVWQHGKAGVWVLLSGLIRYVFVAAGWRLPWLERPLPASRRRQAICVVQVGSLMLAVVPAIPPPGSVFLSAVALAALVSSFAVDVAWLRRHAGDEKYSLQHVAKLTSEPILRPRSYCFWQVNAANVVAWTAVSSDRDNWRWVTLAGALALLNASLSFRNLWPTPAVRWNGDLSVEAAAVVLLIVIVGRWFGAPSRAAIRAIGAFWVVWVIGRYAEVTAPALYGREVNLYWDSRHLSAVGAMLARVASWWQIALIAAAAVAIPAVLYAGLRPALARIGRATNDRAERRVVAIFGTAVIVLFIVSRIGVPAMPPFSAPVAQTYGHQARLLIMEMTAAGTRTVGPPPVLPSDLNRLGGADVFVIFIESYGAVSYDRKEFAAALAPSRARLAGDINETGRHAVSAFVQSPTFGGNSWLAHVSLLSGVEVRDEDTNVLLMAQKRVTAITPFARQGYRTVAVMPGLHNAWPEGAFYGFDEIYGEDRLDYRGPPFGWWSVPDQFAIARMDALAVAKRPRHPVFVFYPTTNTHTPFIPTPPYQQDWVRVLTADPYDQADLARSWDDQPDWLDLGPGYVQSLAYTFRTIGGYLRLRADRDFVMILIGDHQPPAIVSGEGATWEVPVHVIASRTDILDALRGHRFRSGLEPQHPALMRMHELTPVILKAFSKTDY